MALDRIAIRGGRPLSGVVDIRGAKNSALPLMAAAILAEAPCRLTNVPDLADIHSMARLLGSMGVDCAFEAGELALDATGMDSHEAQYDLVRKMRASFFVLGPLLGRFGAARVALPGGCAIGTRPVDIHLKGLEALGVEIRIETGYVEARGVLRGADTALDFPSVGATENLMMAASRAEGTTRLRNVAREPEIVDLASFLTALGARIEGAGSSEIVIEGAPRLGGAEHEVIADRIEAGTFLIAAAATGGDVLARHARAQDLPVFLDKLAEAGVAVEPRPDGVRASSQGPLRAVNVETQPFPGFPTDLQAQTMALLCLAQGASVIRETVFENRFMQVAELRRMGARIDLEGNMAIVHGVRGLSGAPVMASDLRASAALVIAGLAAAEGETVVQRVYHIDRGYERIEERLAGLGADIARVGG